MDNNDNEMVDFSSFFGFTKVTEAKVFLIDMTFDAFNKYELDFQNETSEEIHSKFEKGEIEKIERSEEEKPLEEGQIQYLVAKNFQKIMSYTDMGIFVMFSKDEEYLLSIFEPIQELNKIQVFFINILKNDLGVFNPPYDPAIVVKYYDDFKPFQA